MKHVNISLKGKLYKTGIRFMTMQAAYKIGVYGFVKYLDSKEVYIEAEGTIETIEEFKNWCRNHALPSLVSQISIEVGIMQNFTSFEIL